MQRLGRLQSLLQRFNKHLLSTEDLIEPIVGKFIYTLVIGSNAIPMKNVGLLVFLAVRIYSLPMPLSLMEWNFMTAYYYGTAMPLTIISCFNSKTNDNLQPLVINPDGAITFRAIIRKMISCLIWILDNLNQSRYSRYPRTSWEVIVDINLPQFERNFFSSYI